MLRCRPGSAPSKPDASHVNEEIMPDSCRRTLLLPFIIVLLTSLSWGRASGQNVPGSDGGPVVLPLYTWPRAARHAPRIGGAVEDGGERVRLDIGGTVPLYSRTVDLRSDDHSGLQPEEAGRPLVPALAFGVDFFTWSRLASESNFKFPVEAIDYYFGLYAGREFGYVSEGILFGTLRIAHISAHLVDGEERFAQSGFEPFVYSREFVDVGFGIHAFFGEEDHGLRSGAVRGIVGGRWLFHTIPDTIGRFRPSIAVESEYQPQRSLPVTILAGGEVGLNTELETTLESSLRLGLKLSGIYSNGLILEAGYTSGTSHYGQYIDRAEEYFWFGFSFGT